jgi:hypothetical protein
MRCATTSPTIGSARPDGAENARHSYTNSSEKDRGETLRSSLSSWLRPAPKPPRPSQSVAQAADASQSRQWTLTGTAAILVTMLCACGQSPVLFLRDRSRTTCDAASPSPRTGAVDPRTGWGSHLRWCRCDPLAYASASNGVDPRCLTWWSGWGSWSPSWPVVALTPRPTPAHQGLVGCAPLPTRGYAHWSPQCTSGHQALDPWKRRGLSWRWPHRYPSRLVGRLTPYRASGPAVSERR